METLPSNAVNLAKCKTGHEAQAAGQKAYREAYPEPEKPVWEADTWQKHIVVDTGGDGRLWLECTLVYDQPRVCLNLFNTSNRQYIEHNDIIRLQNAVSEALEQLNDMLKHEKLIGEYNGQRQIWQTGLNRAGKAAMNTWNSMMNDNTVEIYFIPDAPGTEDINDIPF